MCIAHISPYRHYSVLFQVGVLFNIGNVKFWPILSILSQIYALFGVSLEWCTKMDKFEVCECGAGCRLVRNIEIPDISQRATILRLIPR